MSLKELYTILTGISGFSKKVAYRSFPTAVELPFICYLETNTNNAFADNRVYQKIKGIDIELYTETKDESVEGLVETALNENGIGWNKTENYIEDEQCYQIIYSVEV